MITYMTTIPPQSILIFGGTFDPPHKGHLKIALAVQNHFHFDHFMFLPCQTPVLKAAAQATAIQRVEMLKMLIKPYPAFSLNEMEVQRDTPSYMVDTLRTLRQQWGKQVSIILLLGWDAFVHLPLWHKWKELFQLAHILVVDRLQPAPLSRDTETPLKPQNVLNKQIQANITTQASALFHAPCGKVYFFDAGEYPISSTAIREGLKTEQAIHDWLPSDIYAYIKRHQLYHN